MEAVYLNWKRYLKTNESYNAGAAGREDVFFLPVIVLPTAGLPADRTDCISLLPVGSDKAFLRVLYSFLQNHATVPFSFYINHPVEAVELLPFFFLPGSARLEGKTWLAIDPSMATSWQEDFSAGLASQGFTGTMFLPLASQPDQQLPVIYDAVPDAQHFLRQPQHDNLIFLRSTHAATVADLLLSWQLLEDKIRQADPVAWDLRLDMARLRSENMQLRLSEALLREELGNYAAYNRVLQSSHQGNEIQDFYNNEYEVLPGWFKKLGHLVKWIMGKRKWKSVPVAKEKGGGA